MSAQLRIGFMRFPPGTMRMESDWVVLKMMSERRYSACAQITRGREIPIADMASFPFSSTALLGEKNADAGERFRNPCAVPVRSVAPLPQCDSRGRCLGC